MSKDEALRVAATVAAGYVGTHTFTSIYQQPMSLMFNLGSYKGFTFTLGDRSVTFTPEELMDALQQPNTEGSER